MKTVKSGESPIKATPAVTRDLKPGDVVANSSFQKADRRLAGRRISKVAIPSTSIRHHRGRSMSPSRPFILRPVATSLLMAAILLVGIVAFTQLPVSALPEVDYPTIQVLTFYPGASPDVMATTITAPLERQFGEMQGLSQMTSTSAGGVSVIVLQFSLSLVARRRRGRGAVGDQRRADISALRSAGAAGLQQDQSRRRAHPHSGHQFRQHAAVAGRGHGGHAPGAKAVAVEWRGAGQHQRRPEARGAHSGEPRRSSPPTA